MKFGLIGHPIAHSLSPALFKAGYDGRYPYHLIETDDFEQAYRRFQEEFDGINVTAPFKELAFAKADILSEECRHIGATNLLIKTPEGIKAYNSDYLGVRMWLQDVAFQSSEGATSKRTPPTSWLLAAKAHWAVCLPLTTPAARGVARFSPVAPSEDSKQSVLIVGCGGAGKAAAFAAASLGLHCILMNRDCTKAEALARSLSEAGHSAEARPLADFTDCFKDSYIIIYNIPAAIPELEGLLQSEIPSGTKHILEANYKNPSFTRDLIERLQDLNSEIRYTGGQTWLLYQAVTGYEIFTKEIPDLEKMSAVI